MALAATGKVFAAGNPEFDELMKRFLTSAIVMPPGENNDQLTLNCPLYSTYDNRFQFDFMVKVDFSEKSVNTVQAAITDSAIRFQQGPNTVIINRYSGTLDMGSESIPHLMHGTCVAVGEKKF